MDSIQEDETRFASRNPKYGALEHLADMAAIDAARADIDVSDMLSALAQAVHEDDLATFKSKWLKLRG